MGECNVWSRDEDRESLSLSADLVDTRTSTPRSQLAGPEGLI